MIAVRWPAGRPGGAGAAGRQDGAGGPELGAGPAGRHSGGFVVEAGKACDITGDAADRDEVHGDLPGSAVRLVSQVVVTMGSGCLPAG